MNLIDTPGHIDFSYEVSRAMRACEGAILLLDSTQGIQAQTMTTLQMAKDAGLKIIPALSKVDSPLAKVEEMKEELALLTDVEMEDIIETSGKTGAGVEELFDKIINEVPSPETVYENAKDFRALVFDFKYHPNKGIIVFIRVLDGEITKNKSLIFSSVNEKFNSLEVGIFGPGEIPQEKLTAGQIGYIVTGIKKAGVVTVGDTLVLEKNRLTALEGYEKPRPVV
jgi:GTP-binding protein LepA